MAVSAGSLVLALVRLLLRAVCRAEEKKRNEDASQLRLEQYANEESLLAAEKTEANNEARRGR